MIPTIWIESRRGVSRKQTADAGGSAVATPTRQSGIEAIQNYSGPGSLALGSTLDDDETNNIDAQTPSSVRTPGSP